VIRLANSILALLFVACTPPADTLGTPEYFAGLTGTPLELESPIGSCRHYTGLASEGSSAFVWRVSPSQTVKLRESLPSHELQARSNEAEIVMWQPPVGMNLAFSNALQYAEKGECSLDSGIPPLSMLIRSMLESSETVAAQVNEGGDVGDLYIFSPALNLLAQVGYVN